MAGDQESVVIDLVDRVHLLMERYTALRNQMANVSRENDDLRHQIDEHKTKIETIELRYKTAKIATNVLAPMEDKEEARGQINKIVREIDDCIALLNR